MKKQPPDVRALRDQVAQLEALLAARFVVDTNMLQRYTCLTGGMYIDQVYGPWVLLRDVMDGARHPHADDIAVDQFAVAMKAKLAAARAKGRRGWESPSACHIDTLATILLRCVRKGDPVDVGNLAMMLHQRGAAPEVLADHRKCEDYEFHTTIHKLNQALAKATSFNSKRKSDE